MTRADFEAALVTYGNQCGSYKKDPYSLDDLADSYSSLLAEWDRQTQLILKLADRIGQSSHVLGKAAERAVQPEALEDAIDELMEAWDARDYADTDTYERIYHARESLRSLVLKNHKALTRTKQENDDAIQPLHDH